MNIKKTIVKGLVVMGLMVGAVSHVNAQAYSPKPGYKSSVDDDFNLVQGLIGAMSFNSDSFKLKDDGVEYTGDMPTMPYLGGMWQSSFKSSKKFSVGVEAGILFGFVVDSTAFSAGGNGLTVYVRNQFLIVDTMLGLNVDFRPTEKIRLYGGAGPTFMFSNMRLENKSDDPSIEDILDNSASAHDFGLYTRLGVEFKVSEELFVGFQARYVDATLDFDHDLGSVDFAGVQYMASFTQAF